MKGTLMTWGIGMVASLMLATGCQKEPIGAKGEAPEQPAATDTVVLDLNDTNFATQTAQGVVLVDFWAPWCGPCRTQGPIVEQVAQQLGATAKVAKVNVDKASKTAQQHGVQSIPTLIVFKDGKPGKRFVGVTQAATLMSAVKESL